MTAALPTRQFRTDIHGLRAIAVLAVVVFHIGFEELAGGYLGVDVFFVISGYVITGTLLRRANTPPLRLIGHFYARRVLRLLPALIAVLFGSAIIALWLLTPGDLVLFGASLRSTGLFATNFYFLGSADYFAPDSHNYLLLHLWSLAIEEQFYLVYPLVLLALARVPAAARLALISALWSASLGFAIFAAGEPAIAFYHPLARAFELLSGCWLALAVGTIRRPWERGATFLWLTGLVGLVCALTGQASALGAPWGSLLACASTAALIASGPAADHRPLAFLTNPAAQFLGTISYSLYLWHWPLIAAVRLACSGQPGTTVIAGAVALALILATLSTFALERPALLCRWPDRRILACGLSGLLLVWVAGSAIMRAEGWPGRFPPRAMDALQARGAISPFREKCHRRVGAAADYDDRCTIGAAATPDVAVWGDSLGVELAFALGERVGQDGRAVRQITASACPPSLAASEAPSADCAYHNTRMLRGLLDDKAIRTVILTAAYSHYGIEPLDIAPAAIARNVGEAAQLLRAAGKRVVIVGPVPRQSVRAPIGVAMALRAGRDPGQTGRSEADFARQNPGVTAVLATHERAGIAVVDPASIFCRSGTCPLVGANGALLYFDHMHPSVAAARAVVTRWEETLAGPR